MLYLQQTPDEPADEGDEMYRTYKTAQIIDAMTGDVVETVTPTEAAAKSAMRQWMQPGDMLLYHTLGYVTTITIVAPDGSALGIRAELSAA